MIICLKQMFWTSPRMSIEGGEDIETGMITMSIPGTVIGPDTTKIRTGDGPVVIVPYMGDGLTTNGPGMEEGPNTADGRDTEMTMTTDGTLHTPDTENVEATTMDTDTIQSTDQSMPVQVRSATQTKRPGNSSKKTSIHLDSLSSSPRIKTLSRS